LQALCFCHARKDTITDSDDGGCLATADSGDRVLFEHFTLFCFLEGAVSTGTHCVVMQLALVLALHRDISRHLVPNCACENSPLSDDQCIVLQAQPACREEIGEAFHWSISSVAVRMNPLCCGCASQCSHVSGVATLEACPTDAHWLLQKKSGKMNQNQLNLLETSRETIQNCLLRQNCLQSRFCLLTARRVPQMQQNTMQILYKSQNEICSHEMIQIHPPSGNWLGRRFRIGSREMISQRDES